MYYERIQVECVRKGRTMKNQTEEKLERTSNMDIGVIYPLQQRRRIMENEMDKKKDHDMETGIMKGHMCLYGVIKDLGNPTLSN